MANMSTCIRACLDCYEICRSYCLIKGGDHIDAGHLTLLEDSAKICALSADFMLRGSEQHDRTCRVCAEICRACAESCDTFDDPKMKACSKACNKCAKECEKMSG